MARQMKDSGVEWIGEIPEDWKVRRLKSIANIQTGNTPDKGNPDYYTDERGLMWVKSDNLNGIKPIKHTAEYLSEEGSKVARVAPKGSTLVCCIGSIGKYGIIDQNAAYNQQINAITFKNNEVIDKYGMYLISVSESQHWLYANGNVLKILNNEGQGKILFAYPSIIEQQKIADFLDEKVEEIDSVIAKTKEIIEDYKKYRQAIITKTVTKGLNPDVEMKESKINWIGEIPQKWKTIKIKYTSWLKGRIGWQGLKSNEYMEKGAYLITGTDFCNGIINWSSCVHISNERFEEDLDIHIKENDLLITKDGTIGKVAIAKNCPEKVSLNSGVLLIRNTKDFKYHDKYLYFVLLSNQFWTWYEMSQTGNSTIRHLYQEQFYNFEFTYPPIEEQKEIAAYLDDKCFEIEKLIAKKEELLVDLESYKKSLIYEYVTGKKEVE